MRRFFTFLFATIVLASAAPAVSWAQSGDASRERARQQFLRGVELIEQERWEEGLDEFEQSYSTYPTQASLFNRALCLRLLRRYAEAIGALADYRNRYAAQVSSERMAEVEEELATIRRLVGRLNVAIEGPGSGDVYVDDERAGRAPTMSAIVIAPGRHVVEVRAAGFQSHRETVAISSGEELSIRAVLVQAVTNATLEVQVNVPGAQVSVDGAEVGTSPLAESLPVAAGSHRISASRPGYREQEVSVTVAANGSATADVILRPLANLSPAQSGQLTLTLSHADAQIIIDGLAWTEGPLPIGPHQLEVRREGMRTIREDIEINAGQTTALQVQLVPGVDERPSGARNNTLLFAGIGVGAVGVIALGVAVGLMVSNGGRQEDWEYEDTFLRFAWDEYNDDPDAYDRAVLTDRTNNNNDLAETISTMNVVNYLVLGVGGAALATGTVLLILGLVRSPTEEANRGLRFSFSPTPDGFAMGASFEF